jgi:hypothetical protein
MNTGLSGLSLVTGCRKEAEEGISPAKDLMREHGVLNRILQDQHAAGRKITGQIIESAKMPFSFTCLPGDPFLEFTIKIYPARKGVTFAALCQ